MMVSTSKTEYANVFEFASKVDADKQIWIGEHSPLPFKKYNLSRSTNFRATKTLHGRFEVAWFYEIPLSNYINGAWKIILDEMIYLLGRSGYLIIRFSQNYEITVIGIKNFIYRKFGISCRLIFENNISNEYTVCFNITRNFYDEYFDNKWSFILLSRGDREKYTISFLKSIRKYSNQAESEILIVGPYNKLYDKYYVKYINGDYIDEYGEISRKKNDAILKASNSNLCIAHDRYCLNYDFFSGFNEYGYSYEFLTLRQYNVDGSEYPGYCYQHRDGLVWSQVKNCANMNILPNSAYINGGLIFIKKHIIENIKFNDLLLWNQAEDVELSYILSNHSVIPRINFLSSATSFGTDKSSVKHFYKFDKRLLIKKIKSRILLFVFIIYFHIPHRYRDVLKKSSIAKSFANFLKNVKN